MRTTQYVRQEKAFDVRPYLPVVHPDYLAWQADLRAEIARMEAELSPGHLYVVEFTSGVVKVGRSTQPERRIGQHAAMARAHGGGLRQSWTSPEHFCTAATEQQLIQFCTEVGRLVAGREYFDIPFSSARAHASLLAANRLSPGDLSASWESAAERLDETAAAS